MVLAFLPGLALAAGPLPAAGGWRSDAFGAVRLVVDGDRVAGHVAEPGACGFAPYRKVLEGRLVGNVLAGTLTVCQQGAACAPERQVPVLAVAGPEGARLTALVRLEPGCRSPALPDGRLALSAFAPTPEPGGPLVERAAHPEPRQAEALLAQGRAQLTARAWAAAADSFAAGLAHAPDSWAGYLGLGVAEFMRGRVPRAVAAYERSLALEPGFADTHFNLACAYGRLDDAPRALGHLERAVALGFALPEAMAHDADLGRLLGREPGFRALLERARARAGQAAVVPPRRGR